MQHPNSDAPPPSPSECVSLLGPKVIPAKEVTNKTKIKKKVAEKIRTLKRKSFIKIPLAGEGMRADPIQATGKKAPHSVMYIYSVMHISSSISFQESVLVTSSALLSYLWSQLQMCE
jgi:hypothetical protein